MGEKELWEAYHRTTYCVRDAAGNPVYFRLIDPDVKERVPKIAFSIITAWNPMNRPRSESENDKRNQALEAYLKTRSWKYYPTAGATEDHCEEGFTIEGIGEQEALEIGRMFHQHAIVYSRAGDPKILKC